MLESLGIDFQIRVLNDGSKDGTAARLAEFSDDPRVTIVNKPNSGHGPTILEGYRSAVDTAEWVFQCDSDDEMPPSSFPEFWSKRQNYDAIFGIRSGRQQAVARKLISIVSRATVRCLFAAGVADVNVPYRLIRADVLKPIVERIPDDTFAPNILIAGVLAREKRRILNLPVPHQGRRTGTVSIMKWKLWRMAFRAFRQTLCFR
jgi:glycosyltransferase involved in cell wall biosynthesis